MFSEFAGISAIPENLNMPGDVKYHLGASSDREIDGKKIHISLTPNPSHLEMVNSVVLGRVRAKQQYFSNLNDEKTILKTESNANSSSTQNDSANNGRKKIIPLYGDRQGVN
jgi:2-oxoglutarate dehydrogenase complex dehydrogenase (E1) component-like enzyme